MHKIDFYSKIRIYCIASLFFSTLMSSCVKPGSDNNNSRPRSTVIHGGNRDFYQQARDKVKARLQSDKDEAQRKEKEKLDSVATRF